MSEEGNKYPRTMHKGSAKALPLPLDLVGLSLSSHVGDEYQLGHWWNFAGPTGDAYRRGALACRR